MRRARTVLFLSVLLLAGSRAGAQGYFGQNQVQYDKLDWKVIETEHFLVHYYPSERPAVMDAARMAERSYARLSRMLNHEFREKKPLVLYASRSDFGQNNVTGDLGEGTGGVTEALRHRMLLNFTGDYKSFEHVLTHEMVHAFQYDIFGRGRAGGGLQQLAQVQPPLWFMEGMAEYLSNGPGHVQTQVWLRDAALNGNLPTIKQMTEEPNRYFPYRFGEAVWEYIGGRWGDDVIGAIMNAVPNVGIERAMRRELGLSLEDLSEEWIEAMQVKHLPQVAELDRPRKFSEELLSQKVTGGAAPVFVSPTFSNDGRYIVFLGFGSFLRGEVFTDLWLADGETGKRIKRLVKTNENTDAEELRLLYSQSAFSPEGNLLAYTALKKGKDVLYLLDVERRRTVREFDLPLEQVISPTFSPDGRRIAFTGNNGGISDLYVIDVDGSNFQRLTNDRYGDLMPQWSPDGRKLAFATDRAPPTDFATLAFSDMHIATMDLESRQISVLPGQGGHNINPMWSPDGESIAFISDRNGTPNIFLYDFARQEHFQITNLLGGVLAHTELSPAITWARQADRLAFVYYEEGEYNIWSIHNPRRLATTPYQAPLPAVAVGARDSARAAADSAAAEPVVVARNALPTPDSVGGATSLYRDVSGIRLSANLPAEVAVAAGAISVARLLDSTTLALPDTTEFREYGYSVGFQPEYISRPSIGYAPDNFGRGVYGGTTIVLGDLLGNHRLAFSGAINGRISEAQVFAGYTNLGSRLQYTTGVMQNPIFFLSGANYIPLDEEQTIYQETQGIARYVVRQAFFTTLYPKSRYTRYELGASLSSIGRSVAFYGRTFEVVPPFRSSGYQIDSIVDFKTLSYASPYVALVSDNALYGYTGPISGRRFRFQIEPTLGSLRWVDYQADYRRYYPILFNWITFAFRFQSSVAVGRDENEFPKYIGRPDFIRGYDREELTGASCIGGPAGNTNCGATELLGSRVAFANAELRFPLIRRFEIGVLPIALPPVDGLVFYDAGMAWRGGQSVSWTRPESYDPAFNRYPLRSWGLGVRMNLFGFALLRWDYAKPLDRANADWYWSWTLGPSF
jgi:Tol biopolymer transport system component